MEIETKNASLDTLAVTIKTLHVSGKQMTLAVFRQLPIKLAYKDSELWGIVRYSIKDDGDIWLVFSNNGILYRRALILHKPEGYYLKKHRESIKTQKELIYKMQLPTSNYRPSHIQEEKDTFNKLLAEDIDILKRYNDLVEQYNEQYTLSLMTQLFIAV